MLFKPSKSKTKSPPPEAPRRSIPSTILFGDKDDINDLRLAGCGLGSLAIGSTSDLSTVAVDPKKHIGILGYRKDKLDLLEFLTYQFGVFEGSVIFFDCNGSKDLHKNLRMQNPSGVSFHEGRVEIPEAFFAIQEEFVNLEFAHWFDAAEDKPTLLVISNLANFLELVCFKEFMEFMHTARRYNICIAYDLQPDLVDKDVREALLANSGSLVCFNTSSDSDFTERMARMNTSDNKTTLRTLTQGECLVWTSANMFIPTKVKIPQLMD